MHSWEYGDKLKSIISDLGYDCEVIADNGIYKPMSYRPSDNSIRFNTGQVLGVSSKTGYMLKDTFFCIAYHEIGHYLDFRNNPELLIDFQANMQNHEYVYNRECAAYKLGREIITDNRLLEIYDSLNENRINNLKKKMQ